MTASPALFAGLLFLGLAGAVLLSVHGQMDVAEARFGEDARREKAKGSGEFAGLACFAVIHAPAFGALSPRSGAVVPPSPHRPAARREVETGDTAWREEPRPGTAVHVQRRFGHEGGKMAQQVQANVEVEAPVREVYEYWQTLENLPQFMVNVEEVRSTGPDTTHWKVKGPFGRTTMEFDARTTRDEEGGAIAWETVEGQNVRTSGEVRFHELSDTRSRVDVTMSYWGLPGGRASELASRAVANPKVMIEQDLRNFKEIMEGVATPEEIQERTAAASAQAGAAVGVVGFLTSGAGLLGVGGLVLFLLLRRRRVGGSGANSRGGRSRVSVVFEF